ncbi:MAG: CapA family protein [Candidatus Pacebacteria bacterium]|nr:CapA family protein [Candidatus Paceibacterota bacterium]
MKWVFLAALSVLILFLGVSFLIKPEVIETTPKTTESQPEKEINLILVGDIMLNRGVEYKVQNEGNGDFKFPFLNIADYFKKADIVFGNLEGPISDKGLKVGSIYSFRNDPQAIEGLTYAGFNVLSLANNHAFDYGRQALEDTLLRLKNADIDCTGAGFNESESYSPVIKEIDGTKIAFLAYTNLGPETWKASGDNSGIAWINDSDLKRIGEDIKSAGEKSDILIVSLHAGEEYQTEPNQFQVDFAKMAIESGADVVVGHHPHVIQADGKYRESWIFYSLGNFIFDQNFSSQTMRGEIAEVIIKNKTIEGVNAREININDSFQPEIIQ